MPDQVHSHNSPPVTKQDDVVSPKQSPKPLFAELNPPSGTYAIKFPKNHTFNVPLPENSHCYKEYTRKKIHPNRPCRCFCCLIGLVLALILLLGIAIGILYLIFRPKAPKYSIDRISIKGMNITPSLSMLAISSEFDIIVSSNNPNNMIGIYYEKDSYAEIFYNNIMLCNGILPVFYQPSNNVTVFKTMLKGIKLGKDDRRALVEAQTEELEIYFIVKIRAYVKIKVGSVQMWEMTIKVDCGVTVDELREDPEIVSSNCDSFKVNFL